jgi:hypothetical protein
LLIPVATWRLDACVERNAAAWLREIGGRVSIAST